MWISELKESKKRGYGKKLNMIEKAKDDRLKKILGKIMGGQKVGSNNRREIVE